MKLSGWALSVLASGAVVEGQGIDFDKVLKKKPALANATNPTKAPVQTAAIAASITSSLEKIKPKATSLTTTTTATFKATTTSKKLKKPKTTTTTTTTTTTKKHKTKSVKPKIGPTPAGKKASAKFRRQQTCAKTDVWFTYVPTAKDAAGFITDSYMTGLGRGQINYPPGYTLAFSDQYATPNGNSYITYYQLSSMNATACAAWCDSTANCKAFNVYFERTPSVFPGPGCANPTAASSVRCALWSSALNTTQLTNIGQWRQDFMVVMQASLGFNKVTQPASISGFNSPKALAGGIDITRQGSTGASVGSAFYTQTYNPQLCADLCTSTTSKNRIAGLQSRALSFQPCNYFNVLQLSLNGQGQGTYCQLYTSDTSSSTGMYTTTQNAASFDLLQSFGYAVSNPDNGTLPFQPLFTTVSVNAGTAATVATTTLAPTATTIGYAPSIVKLTYPTAVTTCSNAGVKYAAYVDPYAVNGILRDYDTALLKKLAPPSSGVTSGIGFSSAGYSQNKTVYNGNAYFNTDTLAIDHTFYVFANQDGVYNFTIPVADDIELVWIGPTALSNFTRANADIEQTFSWTAAPKTKSVTAKLGDYIPVRVQWANFGGDATLRFDIIGPDGVAVHQTVAGTSTATVGPNLVQFPCNAASGAQFAAWGKQT
ncbi:Hypothetical protein D9617_4g000590 [Elsinoe fawcettii]|nr:Hypothetical protein D9617_4g000590 [Elsinoe fawcettii]